MAFQYDIDTRQYVHIGPEKTGKPKARVAIGTASMGAVVTVQTFSTIPNGGDENDRQWRKGLFFPIGDSDEAVAAVEALMTAVQLVAEKWGPYVEGMAEAMYGQIEEALRSPATGEIQEGVDVS